MKTTQIYNRSGDRKRRPKSTAFSMPRTDGNDDYYAFASYQEAHNFLQSTQGAHPPLALIRQDEYIDEPEEGQYAHVRKVRVAEWPAELLTRPRRNEKTIPEFLSPNAPANRLDILRGLAK